MRFLENLVSDLIKDATGVNPRRAVRRIGGRRLLLMGGLAAAGALAQQRRAGAEPAAGTGAGGSGTGGYAFTKSPGGGEEGGAPSPPPPPGAAPFEPAAAIAADEAFDEIEEELPEHLLVPAVRTMIAAALADGRMAPEEKAAIERRLAKSDLAPDDVSRVHHDLVFPPTVDELAALVADPPDRELLFELACLVLRADSQVTYPERAWLARLGDALEIPEERRTDLSEEVFG